VINRDQMLGDVLLHSALGVWKVRVVCPSCVPSLKLLLFHSTLVSFYIPTSHIWLLPIVQCTCITIRL